MSQLANTHTHTHTHTHKHLFLLVMLNCLFGHDEDFLREGTPFDGGCLNDDDDCDNGVRVGECLVGEREGLGDGPELRE